MLTFKLLCAVLIYDHRGIGNSTLTSAKDEDITIELMARDLLLLLENLKWKEVVICGFSMGGKSFGTHEEQRNLI